MAEKCKLSEQKRKHSSNVEPPTLLQATSQLCRILRIEVKGKKLDTGLCPVVNK